MDIPKLPIKIIPKSIPFSYAPLSKWHETELLELLSYKYINGGWFQSDTSPCQLLDPPQVLSLNIWFDDYEFDARVQFILQFIEKRKPDFVCFQEATCDFLRLLKLSPVIRARYYIPGMSALDGGLVDPYGCLILSLHPVRFSLYSLPTTMGRNLMLAKAENFLCCTVHLESLDKPLYRSKQLEVIAQIFEFLQEENILLTGDFNFDADMDFSDHLLLLSNPNHVIPPHPIENDQLQTILPAFVDLWSKLHPSEKGYTFDSTINRNISSYERMRYDRMIYKSSSMIPQTLEMIFHHPISSLFVSDHFGLLALFT